MKKIMAFGAPLFVRQMQFGGCQARLADEKTLAPLLEETLLGGEAGIVIVDPALARAVTPETAARFAASRMRLFMPERASAALLRDRIREVAGADLMFTNGNGEKNA